MMIGSDTSGLEQNATPPAGSDSFMPVHNYLLIEQGVHIAEFHYLEELVAEESLRALRISQLPTRSGGTTAGFTMRPLAIYCGRRGALMQSS